VLTQDTQNAASDVSRNPASLLGASGDAWLQTRRHCLVRTLFHRIFSADRAQAVRYRDQGAISTAVLTRRGDERSQVARNTANRERSGRRWGCGSQSVRAEDLDRWATLLS